MLLRCYSTFPLIGKSRIAKLVFSRVFSVASEENDDPYQQEIIKSLDRLYRKNKYTKYIQLFERNKKWLYENRLSKYFSWAAVVTKGTSQSLEYCCKAVELQPKALNDITTAIIEDAYPDKEQFKRSLSRAAFDSEFSTPIILVYVLIKLGESRLLSKLLSKDYVRKVFPDDELLESYSLIGQHQSVIELFESSNDSCLVRLPIYELVYDSYTKLNQLDKALLLFQRADKLFNGSRTCLNKTINPHAINNKLERQFWFQKGDLIRAYSTYKRQRLSQVLATALPNLYTQSLAIIESSEQPLVLASWGPGDEIRFSRVYNILHGMNSRVTISCEPRLQEVLSLRYPDITFLPVSRTRRVDARTAPQFNKLPTKKLHHILDNKTYSNLECYSHVCLLTDILSELVEKGDFQSERKIQKLPKFRPDTLRVGISWSSSIQTANRNEHYFSFEDLSALFTIPNVRFYNLQYGDCSTELDKIEKQFGVRVIDPNIDQFNDFGAVLELMDSLDVILSVGTTVLELSGLSKTPVYALTNSKAFQYRACSDGTDFWFKNIHYIDGFSELSKAEVTKEIVKKIIHEDSH